VQAIDLPDGRLVVQSNASRAVLDAWDESVTLVAVSLALLLLVNGLVFWVVGRTVRPFGRIVAALNELEAGRFDVALPPLPGSEAAAIGGAFNRMLGVLQDNIEAERRALRAERELSDNRKLGRWIEQHIDTERRLIARELHDELGQSVTAIRSMALSVAQRVQSVDAESERAARLIAEESSRLYDAMHGLIPRLAPLVLDSLGLTEALDDLVERTRRSHPAVFIELDVDLGDAGITPSAALALYRAAQEGITNALRHGDATRLWLELQAGSDGLSLDLRDDGRGLPAEGTQRSGHYGLRWLAERVEALGGRFSVAPAQPCGVRLQVHLPLSA
jgi:two-component system sensor histidine kinase UhpB